MTEVDCLAEAYSRLPDLLRGAVSGLTADQLRWTPDPGANSIGWLAWHLTRIQDHHISHILNQPQVWTSGSWARDVGLKPDPDNTGYGHTPKDVPRVRPTSSAVLIDYYAAVSTRTLNMIMELSAADLSKIVDDAWDPPVTMRVRLVSVLGDDMQHVGQAAYVRGLLQHA